MKRTIFYAATILATLLSTESFASSCTNAELDKLTGSTSCNPEYQICYPEATYQNQCYHCVSVASSSSPVWCLDSGNNDNCGGTLSTVGCAVGGQLFDSNECLSTDASYSKEFASSTACGTQDFSLAF